MRLLTTGKFQKTALALSALASLTVLQAARADTPHYHQIAKFSVAGEGGWDYLTVDSKHHRLFLSRSTHVTVVDTLTHKVVGEIAETPGVHGIAVATSLNKGFTSNGRDSTVTVFDLTTLKTIEKVKVSGQNPDCIIYDPATQRVFTFNGRSGDSSVIDAKSNKEIGTISVGGRPEYAQADGKGGVFLNIEDKSELVAIDAKALKVLNRWSIAPGEGPSGLAIDPAHHLTFSVTDGKMMVSNTMAGKVAATVEIGDGPDAAGYDPKLKLAFSSNGGSGTLTVVHEDSPTKFTVVDNVKTAPGARTMALDPTTHYVYLVTADFAPAPAAAAGQRQRRQMLPNSFTVLVYGP